MRLLLQEKGRTLRRMTHFFAALFLLLVLPGGVLSDLKFSYMRERHPIEESLSFSCGEDQEIQCYTPGGERDSFDKDAMSYVFLPSYADSKALKVETWTPRVEFELGDRRTVVSSKRAAVLSFEENEPYTVYFYDARGREAGRKSVTFLKSGNLPTLYVSTETGSMEQLDADKKYKEGGYVKLFDPEGNLLMADSLQSISGRGNHTFEFEKKSYQIRLSSSADLLNMGASDTWILLCNVFDLSYVRNKLTYDMALQAEMEEYQKKFADYIPQMAREKIAEYLQQIEKSAVLDQARFAHVYREIGGDGDYRAQAEYVKEFLLERKKFLDEVWLEGAPVCQIWFGDGEGREFHRLGVIEGECIRELPLDREEGVEFKGWRIEGSDAFLTTEMPITEDLKVYGVWE